MAPSLSSAKATSYKRMTQGDRSAHFTICVINFDNRRWPL